VKNLNNDGRGHIAFRTCRKVRIRSLISWSANCGSRQPWQPIGDYGLNRRRCCKSVGTRAASDACEIHL
jgi:hypothetical protein